MNRWKKISLFLLSIIFVIIIYVYLYPAVSTYIPRSIKFEYKGVFEEGVYYPINMEQIKTLKVDSTKIIMTGYDLSFFKPTSDFNIIRNIPDKYLPLNGLDIGDEATQTPQELFCRPL